LRLAQGRQTLMLQPTVHLNEEPRLMEEQRSQTNRPCDVSGSKGGKGGGGYFQK
jgi:hypothetical protein